MKYLILTLTLLLLPMGAFAAQGNAVEYQEGDRTYEGYYITPAKDAPLILLIHDWDGLTDYEIERSKMLADLGYAVFSADLFGKRVRPTKTADKRRITGELYGNRKAMLDRMLGALTKAKELGANVDNALAMGYCFGGTAVLELARSGTDLKAFVTFHGGLETPKGQSYANTKGEVLVFHGSADTAVPLEQFAALAKELEAAHIPHEMTTYSGAPHAFSVFGSPRYHKTADLRSWARFTQFLNATLN